LNEREKLMAAEQIGRRRPLFRQEARFLRSAFLIEVDKDLSNHHRVFHAGDDPERTTALPAGLKKRDFLKTPQ
jgi:hypothetical protein